MTGFTDRTGLAGGDARPVTVVVNLLGENPASLHVGDTTELGVTCWLPKSQLSYEPGDLAAARARRGQGRPALLKLTLPAWLARDRGLATVAGDGQGRLF